MSNFSFFSEVTCVEFAMLNLVSLPEMPLGSVCGCKENRQCLQDQIWGRIRFRGSLDIKKNIKFSLEI